MTEPNESNTAPTKKSVVDDFFSALFANNNNNSSSTPTQIPEVVEEEKVIPNGYKPTHYHDVDSATQQDEKPVKSLLKRERVLDEFDEYSLLSKRRNSKDVKKNHELDEKLERQILSKRDIDWSNVKPESRMLVRQLPKFIHKEDVMTHFSKYGEVLEVVQKTPFGFVHFENPEACAQAVQAENGQSFHGIILELEICRRKPFFARAQEKEKREKESGKQIDIKPRRDSSPQLRNGRSEPNHQQQQQRPNSNGNGGRQQQQQQQQQQGRRNRPEPPIRNNDYRPDYGRVSVKQENNYRGDTYRQSNNDTRYNNNDSRYSNNESKYNSNDSSRYNNNDTRYNSNDTRYNNNDSSRYNSNDSRYNSSNHNNNHNSNNYGGDRSPYRNESQYNDPTYNSRDPRYNNNTLNTRNNESPSYRYDSYKPAPLIPSRQGIDVPMVQIVSWDSVAYGYTDYIERVFSSNGIRSSSITLPFSNHTKEEIVKQMILEGVKAIVMIDRQNEAQNKVYLQVFAPVEYGQAVRFDEYDSVTALEAVSIIHRMHPPVAAQPAIHHPVINQPAPIAPPVVAANPQPVDMNTLASLYSMLQQPKPMNTYSPPVGNQPTIPQLLATLMNGLGAQQQPQPQPAVVPTPSPPLPAPIPTQQNNSDHIAALISTAASGNPALAQLLAQMTSGTNNELSQNK